MSIDKTPYDQRRRARQLRGDGLAPHEVAEQLRAEYPGLGGLAAMRQANGWSQEQAAEQWNRRWPDRLINQKTLSRWECWQAEEFDHAPGLNNVDRLAQLYQGSGGSDLLAGWAEYRVPAYPDDVDRRTFSTALVGAIGAGFATSLPSRRGQASTRSDTVSPRVGLSDVERGYARIDELNLLGHRVGGGGVHAAKAEHLRDINRLLGEGRYSSDVEQQLRSLAGHQQRELAWSLNDAGHAAVARHHFDGALSTAHLANDPELVVWTLIGLSELAYEHGDGATALLALDAAERSAGPIRSDRLSSLLSAHQARAFAVAREPAAAEAALARAERLYRDHDPDRDPLWLGRWWNPAALNAYGACTFLACGKAQPAEHAAHTALTMIDTDAFPRNAASYSTTRVLALAEAGNIDEAAKLTVETLAQLDGIHSPHTTRRLTPLRPIFEANPRLNHIPQALSVLPPT